MLKKNIKKITFYFFIFLFLFSLDRISKVFALNYLKNEIKPLFKGLNLSLVFNRGISFGLLNFDVSFLFYSLTLIIFLVITFFLLFAIGEGKKGEPILCNVFVIAGAYSNLLDRILYRGVVDYIDFYVGTWHWPTFNLADTFIVIGVFGILGRLFYDGYFRKH